jgi:hypothetical protein
MANIPKGLKPNSSRSIRFDWNTEEFEKNLEELRKEIQFDTKDILIRNAPKFTEAAAKYTPPTLGKNTIEKTRYERPVLVLSRLVNGGYSDFKPTQEDINQLRKKMVYKVLYTKAGVPKGTAYAYCKTKGQAKKLSKIKTRGLARVMWGKGMEQIGAKTPNSVLRLMKKSPDIASMNYSKQSIINSNDETALIFENSAKFIERIADLAKRQGFKKIMNAILKDLKQMANKDREV